MIDVTQNETLGVTPESLFKILKPQEFKGVVVLALKDIGQVNEFYASTITVEQLIVLHAQLGAHIATILGPMKEGF